MKTIHPSQMATPCEQGKECPSYIIPILLFQQLLGAITFPISKYGLQTIDPFTFAFFRFLISSSVLLLIVAYRKKTIPVSRQDFWKIIGLGVLIIPLNQTLFLWGQSMTAAGHGSLLFATVPIWILLAALIHLKEKPTSRRLIGIILGVIGVSVVMAVGAVEFNTEYLWGDLIILLAVIAWAYYTILGKPLVQKYGAFRVTAYALGSGSLMYLPFGLYSALRFDYSGTTVAAWGSVLYMALGTSVIAYVLWYWILKYMEASRIAVFNNLQPIIAAGVAFFWLHEPLGWSFVIGGSLAICGVLIAEL